MSPHYFNPSHPQQVPASPLILLFLPSCLPICCELCINLSLRRSVNRCGVNQSLGFPFISLSSQWLKREKKEEEEGARLHYQHTHTHTGYIMLWKRCGSSGKSGPRVFPLLPSFFDCFLWFSSSFCFYPSSDEQLRGCIFKHHGVSLRCLSPKYLLVLKNPQQQLRFLPFTHPSLNFFSLFLVLLPPSLQPLHTHTEGRSQLRLRDHRGNIFSHFSKCTFSRWVVFTGTRRSSRADFKQKKRKKARGEKKRWWWDFNSWFVPPFYVFLMTLRRALDFSFRPLCISLFFSVWVSSLVKLSRRKKNRKEVKKQQQKDAGSSLAPPVASVKTHRQCARTPLPLRVTLRCDTGEEVEGGKATVPTPFRWEFFLFFLFHLSPSLFLCSFGAVVARVVVFDFLGEAKHFVKKCPSYQAAETRSFAPQMKWSRSKTRGTRRRSRSSPSWATRKRKGTWQTSSHLWSTSRKAAPTATTWVTAVGSLMWWWASSESSPA